MINFLCKHEWCNYAISCKYLSSARINCEFVFVQTVCSSNNNLSSTVYTCTNTRNICIINITCNTCWVVSSFTNCNPIIIYIKYIAQCLCVSCICSYTGIVFTAILENKHTACIRICFIFTR